VGLGLYAKKLPCNLPSAPTVATAVTRPDGGLVDHVDTGLVVGAGSLLLSTTITVTPADFDSLGFTATFEPALGSATAVARVGLDRRNVAASFMLPGTLVGECEDLALTSRQTVVCQEPDGGKLIRDGGLALAMPMSIFAVSGNSIWVGEGTNLVRYFDDGTGVMPSERLTIGGAPRGLVPTDDSVIAIFNDVVRRYVVDAGSLAFERSWRFDAGEDRSAQYWFGAWDSSELRIATIGAECSSSGAPPGELRCAAPVHSVSGVTEEGIWSGTNLLPPVGPLRSGPELPANYRVLFPSMFRPPHYGDLPKICWEQIPFNSGCGAALTLGRDVSGQWRLAGWGFLFFEASSDGWFLVRDFFTHDVTFYRSP
jgi:hypothetical protein